MKAFHWKSVGKRKGWTISMHKQVNMAVEAVR